MRNKLERLKRIRELMSENNQVTVAYLSELFDVSEQTIRSDLENLENEGFLTRFHGGASVNSMSLHSYGNRIFGNEIANSTIKQKLGKAAANIVTNKESIFIGPGTSVYYIALELSKHPDIHANIVTNNFYVASILNGCSNFRLQFIGGISQLDLGYTACDDLEHELDNKFFDKLFFSTDGADLSHGYTLSDPPAHSTITLAGEHSQQIVSLIDSAKFDRQSFFKIGDLDYAQTVVTDSGIPDSFLKHFNSLGVNTIVVD